MYVKVTSGAVDQYPYTIGQLRRDNPNTSFPKVIPEAMLADWDVYPVTKDSQPAYTERTQTIAENAQPTLVNNAWAIGWTVSDKTDDEVTAYDDQQEAILRHNRNSLLADSDWTQLADSPLTEAKKAEWATYRTALRDLTAHANWPYLENNDWPLSPQDDALLQP